MNKKILLCSLAGMTAIATITAFSTSGAKVFKTIAEGSGTWHHYQRVDATQTTKGIREYWVKCGDGVYSFTKPEVADSSIVEMTEAPSTAEFAVDDDRYIYPVTLDAQKVYMTSETKSIPAPAAEYTVTSNYKVGSIDLGSNPAALDVSGFATDHSDDGERVVTVDATKEGKVYTLFTPTTFVTKQIATFDDFATLIPNATNATATVTYRQGNNGLGVLGYYEQTADITIDPAKTTTAEFAWTRVFQGTYDGQGYTIYGQSVNSSKGAGTCGAFVSLDGATLKNITVADTHYAGWGASSLLAKAIYNTKFENCKFRIDVMRSATPSVTSSKDSGWISFGLFMNNKVNNCVFDAKGIAMGHIFGSGANFANNTFADSVLLTKSLVSIFTRNDVATTTIEGLRTETTETIVSWTQEDVDKCVADSEAKYPSATGKYTGALFAADSGYRAALQRASARIATNQYAVITLPKVAYNEYDYVTFRVATTNGTRKMYFPKSATDQFHQAASPLDYGPTDNSSNYKCADIWVKGNKVYFESTEIATIYNENILNGTEGLNFIIKGGASGKSGYNNTLSDLICYKAA